MYEVDLEEGGGGGGGGFHSSDYYMMMHRLAIWSAQDLFRRKPALLVSELRVDSLFILSSRTLLKTLPGVHKSMIPL